MAGPVYEDQASVAKLVCDKFFLYASSVMEEYPALSENMETRVKRAHDHVNRCVLFLKTWMLDGHKVARTEMTKINFPASPWDFFKQEYFPKWALERWPVKQNEMEVPFAVHHHHICPHLVVDDRHQHIMFMYEGVNGKKPV